MTISFSLLPSFSNERCPICLKELLDTTALGHAIDSTQHVFHESCIIPWLQQNASCPMCRFPVENVSVLQGMVTAENTRKEQFVQESLANITLISEAHRGLAVRYAALLGNEAAVKDFLANGAQISPEDRSLAIRSADDFDRVEAEVRGLQNNQTLRLSAADKGQAIAYADWLRSLASIQARLADGLPVSAADHSQAMRNALAYGALASSIIQFANR
jgi:hypothetical protein